jgi:membrane-associated phospholipid phosphatase
MDATMLVPGGDPATMEVAHARISQETQMTETAPSRRSRLTDVPSASPDEREGGHGFVWRFWVVVVLWAAIVAERSAALGVPVRDPEGQMFRDRLVKALVFLVVIALAEAVVRARPWGWSWRNVVRVLRERWTASRLLLVVTGLVGYHVVYLGYRNLKSWNAFNPLRDDDLLAWDRALFLGHSPWEMLHTLLGESYAAEGLAVVYRSFTYVIVLALVGSLALIPRVQKAYVFLSAATWAWILGTLCYYLLPSLGPYAAVSRDFEGLRHTPITDTQAEYLVERAAFLADHTAPDAFVSLGAFASLHVGFTTLVFLMARYYGLRRVSRVLAVYLAAVIISTVYFGWHYVLDDIAGVLIALTAVQLGKWTVDPSPLLTRLGLNRRREPV